MVAGGRGKQLRVDTFYHKHTEGRETGGEELGKARNSPSPPLGMHVLQQGCTTTLNSTTTQRPSIQKPEPTRGILIQKPYMTLFKIRELEAMKLIYLPKMCSSKQRKNRLLSLLNITTEKQKTIHVYVYVCVNVYEYVCS